ncbi:MAG TPA: glycosyltransferase [Planctomycetaceae bacterium]|jgi:glycosyltransferase involved in cell wall biosynthesis|nr:glycosyltransferase [Planctomycetaceae bacterium]
MKITHVIPYMHPAAGGPPVVVDRLSRELAARGHELTVLTTDLFAGQSRDWVTDESRPYGMEVFSAAAGNGFGFSVGLWREIGRAIRNSDVVHIHTLWTFPGFAAARACSHAGIPYLVMPHGMLDPHSVGRKWLKKQCYGRLLEWPSLRRAQGMCYTHPEEQRLAALTCRGLPRGHIVELGAESPPDCPRSELRAEFLKRHPELRDRTVVLFLGRLHSKKGLDLLIPAFDIAKRQRPDANLLLVGPGDPAYVQSIREEVGRRGLEKTVTFTGLLSGRDKWAAMAASDLFVLPSYQENFALTVVDAIQSGLPVLVSRRVNIWKDLVDAGAARDCEPELNSVAATLSDCLSDLEWRHAAARAGKSLLSERFNWATTAARLETIYEAVRLPSESPALVS